MPTCWRRRHEQACRHKAVDPSPMLEKAYCVCGSPDFMSSASSACSVQEIYKYRHRLTGVNTFHLLAFRLNRRYRFQLPHGRLGSTLRKRQRFRVVFRQRHIKRPGCRAPTAIQIDRAQLTSLKFLRHDRTAALRPKNCRSRKTLNPNCSSCRQLQNFPVPSSFREWPATADSTAGRRKTFPVRDRASPKSFSTEAISKLSGVRNFSKIDKAR